MRMAEDARQEGPIRGPIAVVVSYYDARPAAPLQALVRGLLSGDAGAPFELRVVVNHDPALATPVALDLPAGITVAVRENVGFNIGAWEHGWRMDPPRDAYLFLQDECVVRATPWLSPFVRAAEQPGVGLVGERLSPPWNAPWDELARRFAGHSLPGHEIEGRAAERIACYLHYLRAHGIDPGAKGDHLQTLALFARRSVLVAMGGFPVGRNYGEAIAAEIGTSKRVQTLGLGLREVGREPFTVFAHPQWLARAEQHRRMGWRG